MDAMLILRNVKVENANAISGVTWGFPGISAFLGFVHALSRKQPLGASIMMDGCAIVSHQTQIHASKSKNSWEYRFALTRNPLTKKGESSSFAEEGRLNMTVSLVIPLSGELPDDYQEENTVYCLKNLIYRMKMVGGTIIDIGDIEIIEPPEDPDEYIRFERSQMRRLLPGFVLVERSTLLSEYTREALSQHPELDPLTAWISFFSLQYEAVANDAFEDEEKQATWRRVERPETGWFVPITIGFRRISDLYKAGEVSRTRDCETPFCFVESVYTIGQWISPHRVKRLAQLFWNYSVDEKTGWYLCANGFEDTVQS